MEARWSAMVGWERLWGGSEHLRKAVDKAAGERKQNIVVVVVVVDATLPRSAGAYGPPELAAAAGLV